MKPKNSKLPYIIIIAAAAAAYWFWGYPAQLRNLDEARAETEKLSRILKTDRQFSDITFAHSAAYRGRLIMVKGTVPDQNSLDLLKTVVSEGIPPKFQVGYAVKIKGQIKPAAEITDANQI